MNTARKAASFALAFNACIHAASATTWYVDSLNGSDTPSASADGLSVATPWLSMTKADSVALPGDTVYVRAGKGYGITASNGSAAVEFTHGGTSASGYVTWTGYPGDTMPVIRASGATGEFAAVCFGAPYIIFNGFDVAGQQGRQTLATAWANASQTSEAGQNSASFNETGVAICSDGFPAQLPSGGGSTTASSAHPSAASTINFSALPAGTATGDVVMDYTTPTKIPAGTTITGITGTTHITLSANNTVSAADGIAIFHKRGHIQITNNKVHDWPGNGINTNYGDYFTISGNLSYNNGFWSPSGNSGISVRAVDEDTFTGTKIVITSNIAYNNQNFVGCDCFSNQQTSATTATAHNASGPSTVTVGSPLVGSGTVTPSTPFSQWLVYDATLSTRIPVGTTMTNLVGSVITLSNPNTIVNGDTILIEGITDGEGIILDDLQGTQGEGTPIYGGRQLVQNNLVFNNGSSGILTLQTSHTDVIGNTLYLNQQYVGEQFYGDPRDEGAVDSNWFNNAIETCSGCQLFFDHSTSTTAYGNNLNHGGGGFQGQTTLPGSNNVDNTVAAWVAPSLTAPTNIGMYPFGQYFTNFQLTPSSPAIDAGSASVQPRTTTDILGNPGLAGPSYDIGAFESPCSPFSGNTVQTMTAMLSTLLADNQAPGSIVPKTYREMMTTAACGRSPYAH